MKYDLQAIMTMAWEIQRRNRNSGFGHCLGKAWAAYKDPLPQTVYEVVCETPGGMQLIARTSWEGEAYHRRDVYNRTFFGRKAKVTKRKGDEMYVA